MALDTVWLALVEALEGIREGPTYGTTVRTVTTDPAVLTTWPALRTPAIVVVVSEERSAHEVEAFQSRLGSLWVFALHVRIDDHALDARRRVTTYATLRADVWTALDGISPKTISEWRWWGGEGPEHDEGMLTATWYVALRERT